jgi:hypothetical protein
VSQLGHPALEKVGVGVHLNPVLCRVAYDLEWAGTIEVGEVRRSIFDDQCMVVAQVEQEERIGRLEGEHDAVVTLGLNVGNVAVQISCREAQVRIAKPIECVNDIFGRERCSIMKTGSVGQIERVRQSVIADGPICRQAWLDLIVGIHIHQVVIHGIGNQDLRVG